MDGIIDRREFLQMSVATGAMLLTGDGLVNLAYAAEPMNFIELDRVAIAMFQQEMPDQFILNTAGTRYVL